MAEDCKHLHFHIVDADPPPMVRCDDCGGAFDAKEIVDNVIAEAQRIKASLEGLLEKMARARP